MRWMVKLLFLSSLMYACGRAHAIEPIRVPMTADHWHVLGADSMGPKGDAEFVRKEGFPQGLLVLKAGSAALDGLMFGDGTIEYDFKPLAADMPGLQFRVSGPDHAPEGEEVYERIFGDERASNDGIQYAPMIHGFMLWNVYPQYENRAPLFAGWNHMRIVVSGRRMNVYINDLEKAVLSVDELASGSAVGAIHLRGPAVFANLVITPGLTMGLGARAVPDPVAKDRGIVWHWNVSTLQPLPKNSIPSYSKMPVSKAEWHMVSAEYGGLLNLNRQFTLADGGPAIVWLRFTVQSDRTGLTPVALGWLGEVWVYANGVFVTSGKNFYYPETERRYPDGRMSIENGTFELPLHKGDNEVALALHCSIHGDSQTSNKYGWGIMMRFTQPGKLSFLRNQ